MRLGLQSAPAWLARLTARWARDNAALPREHRLRVERLVAYARAFLSAAAVAAVFLDPGAPTLFANVSTWLVGYTVFAVAVVALTRFWPDGILRWQVVCHSVDIAIAAVVTALTNGPSSPFFAFFIFILLSAALRWGFWPTLASGAVAVACYVVEAITLGRFFEELEFSGFLMRLAYLLVTVVVLAQVAGVLVIFRTESALLPNLLVRVKRSDRFTVVLQDVLGTLGAYAGARLAILVVANDADGRLYAWQLSPSRPDAAKKMTMTELTEAEREALWFDLPKGMIAWHASTRHDGSTAVRGLTNERAVAPGAIDPRPHRRLLDAHTASEYSGVAAALATWHVRLLFVDPVRSREADLQFMYRATMEVGPVLHSQYLNARLRARIGDVERARIARDLHDGLIQSLIGLEMEIEALKRRPPPAAIAEIELAAIQERLHGAILDTRDLMAEMRQRRAGRDGLLSEVTAIADRFRHDTGIDARVMSSVDEVDVAPRTAIEVARIVQEALVNVRKHATANRVTVGFSRTSEGWQLTIDDNGRGFWFEGVMTLDDLDRQRTGPLVIKERVRAIGGGLTIRSEPGRGSCLQVSWPFSRRYGG